MGLQRCVDGLQVLLLWFVDEHKGHVESTCFGPSQQEFSCLFAVIAIARTVLSEGRERSCEYFEFNFRMLEQLLQSCRRDVRQVAVNMLGILFELVEILLESSGCLRNAFHGQQTGFHGGLLSSSIHSFLSDLLCLGLLFLLSWRWRLALRCLYGLRLGRLAGRHWHLLDLRLGFSFELRLKSDQLLLR